MRIGKASFVRNVVSEDVIVSIGIVGPTCELSDALVTVEPNPHVETNEVKTVIANRRRVNPLCILQEIKKSVSFLKKDYHIDIIARQRSMTH
jgi:hypothetical protein